MGFDGAWAGDSDGTLEDLFALFDVFGLSPTHDLVNIGYYITSYEAYYIKSFMFLGLRVLSLLEEMYQLAIDGDIGLTQKIVIAYSGLKMNMFKKAFSEALGESIMKFNGGRKNEELANKVLGPASDQIKLATDSEVEISKLPGYVLETKVNVELASRVESELLCRAYFGIYLGENTMKCYKESKEMFGQSMLSLF
ncbi:chalcone isomerase-like protein 1 [Humulus lupulus]|uniref:chalcone isomerase-like protein 1 n=1 Tax=Humulus lupulus TaxID=3486 RepID=UPI002B41249E|nr:chalcone isomerase-like protein 1 [Humulus lupulus]